MNKFTYALYIAISIVLFNTTLTYAQNDTEMPKLVEKDGRYALYVDGKPYMILGGQSSNSSTWPKMMPNLWNVITNLNANTLEIPIYWEQVEPQPGQYDFSILQMLLDQAREHDIRLVILWFATWKNGSNHYVPEWIKNDSKKYPNIIGNQGQYVDSPSPHATATMEADAKAFVEVMKYLKEKDPQHTVIMVQVENEPGAYGSVRDYSKTANKLFEQKVPEALLQPKVLKELNVSETSKGTWSEVFGERADEYFHAWYVASYIEYVAAAGKKVNPLPMYVNAALRDPLTNPMATEYESGGPTDNVIPIYKVAAPSIDLVAPDIYLTGDETVLKIIDLYSRPDNALFVPETGGNVRYIYRVLQKGIGYAPFGVDGSQRSTQDIQNSPLALEYKLLVPMSSQLATWSFEGKIHTLFEPQDHREQSVKIGNWEVVVTFGGRRNSPPQADQPVVGKAMIIELGENEFLTIGTNCRYTFRTTSKNEGKNWQYLKAIEGYYENGQFEMIRVLNGDQTDWGGPAVGSTPTMIRFTLVTREN